MNRLTLEERRRLLLAQQQAKQATRDQLRQPAPGKPYRQTAAARHLRVAVGLGMIAALLCGGAFAIATMSFHMPARVAEVLLPRL